MIRFFIKSFFFLTLFLVVVSFFGTSQKNNGSAPDQYMNTVEAFLAVKDTFNDLGNFCERNSETCKTGRTFFGSLGERARDGARLAYEYLDRTFGSDKTKPEFAPEKISTGSITSENNHAESKKTENNFVNTKPKITSEIAPLENHSHQAQ